MGEKTKNYLKTFVKAIVTLVLIYLVFKKVDVNEVFQSYKNIHLPYLLLALVFLLISKIFTALRLNRMFRVIDIAISEMDNIRLTLLGMFYNLTLPGGIGGDGYKVYILKRRFKVKNKRIISAVIIDRANGLLMLFCLLVGLFFWVDYSLPFKWAFIFLIPLSILAFYLALKWFFSFFVRVMHVISIFSLLTQLSQLISVYFIMRALNVTEFTMEYLFIFLVSTIVTLIPFTLGGFGAREITFLYGAQFLGLNENLAVSISFMFYLLTALISLSGVYFSIYTKKVFKDSMHV